VCGETESPQGAGGKVDARIPPDAGEQSLRLKLRPAVRAPACYSLVRVTAAANSPSVHEELTPITREKRKGPAGKGSEKTEPCLLTPIGPSPTPIRRRHND